MTNIKYGKLAEIAITDDGKFYINYLGTHGDQVGSTYRYGGMIVNTLESALRLLHKNMKDNEDNYLALIKQTLEEKSVS